MTRRSFKTKRRRRSGSNPAGGHHEGNGVNARAIPAVAPPQPSSLEEDLRQQRLRQQKRDKEVQGRKARNKEAADAADSQPPSDLTDETYAAQQVASSSCPHHLILKAASTAPLRGHDSSIRLPSSLPLWYVQQASAPSTAHQRGRIRQLFHSKYLMEGMFVNARAAALYGVKLKWVDHTLPDGLHCSWDLTCKYHLHSSARTMDVAMVGTDCLPTVATTVQGGWATFRPPRTGGTGPVGNNAVHTFRDSPVQAIRIQAKSGLCGTVLRSPEKQAAHLFKIFSLPHAAVRFGTNVDLPIHDFCFGTDLVLFSCPRYHSSGQILPLFLPLEATLAEAGVGADSGIRSLNVRNFPQSDALRVEMACDRENKFVAFGHRNGQVSLLDLRTSNVCTLLQYEGPPAGPAAAGVPLGSASDLGFLSAGGPQLLVKRSFGSCQLHDLRKSSSSSSSSSSTLYSSASVVHHLTVPWDKVNPTLSANCNGFATDPSGGQTLVSPYVSDGQDACLGVWSLGTGLMVGSRVLLPNTPDRDTMFVELCQNPAAAFSSSFDARSNSDAFAVWLKCGAYTKGKITSKVGSLHQVSFPTNWK